MFVSSSSHLSFDIIYPVNQVGYWNKQIFNEVNKENVMRKRPIFETVVLSAALVFIPLVTRAALYGDSKIVAARRQESREAGSGWFLWNRLQIAA